MKVSDLLFSFPNELIATYPERPTRVMCLEGNLAVQEISLKELLNKIPTGDVLVLNNTKVLKRRVFVEEVEILFLKQVNELEWEVLFPSRKMKIGEMLGLPLGVNMTLIKKGRPQIVQLSQLVNENYFQKVAELPLPPYIQKERRDRHALDSDEAWYQPVWARTPGSFAAPTASLHFTLEDIRDLKNRGVVICEVTLHVGLGTFLPVTSADLNDHEMHEEYVEIGSEAWSKVLEAKAEGRNVWAMGTTSVRSLESAAAGILPGSAEMGFAGFTRLLIQPGFEFKIVDCLLTNFHQPQSTLLALVAAFSSLETVKSCYQWAIERKFRLFSYGDLTCWTKKII